MSAFGAFASGLGNAIQRRQDREYNERRDARLDAMLASAPQPGPMAAPMAMGLEGQPGGAGASPTTFKGGGNKDAFIEAMMPHALRVSEATGLDPRLVIAQAAQETGWGRSAPNNNFFGIKSHGRKGGAKLATTEYVDGRRVNVSDSYRGYADMGESADDYAAFIKANPRYRDMLAAPDLESQIAALGRSGYATDPNYARSISAIANGITMPARPMAAPPPITVETLKTRWPRPLGVGSPM